MAASLCPKAIKRSAPSIFASFKVAILVKDNIRSIQSHLRTGQAWINNTKTGFQKILYNEKQFSSPKFNTDINNILFNKLIVDDIDADYVIVAAPFFLASMDFRPLISAHIKSGKDISAVYKHIDNADEEYLNCDSLIIKDGCVVASEFNDGKKKEADISLETFIMSREVFDGIVALSRSVSSIYTFRKILGYTADNGIYKVNPISLIL